MTELERLADELAKADRAVEAAKEVSRAAGAELERCWEQSEYVRQLLYQHVEAVKDAAVKALS